jgi:integrase
MSVQRRGTSWQVTWREGGRQRGRTFDRKRDADALDVELRRRRRLGTLSSLDAGTEPLDAYVTETWAPTYAALLGPKTRHLYTYLYDHHIAPTLGGVPLRDLTPELIGRWQADRLSAGAGPVVVRKALTLLGGILQRAVESQRIPSNAARLVRKAKLPARSEVRPLAPATVEVMRAAASPRNAALLSVLAYSGLRPGEALALRWGDVRERTLLVERSLSLGVEKNTKTGQHRTVRLLAPLGADLREWRLDAAGPADRALVFPGIGGRPWSEPAYESWRKCAFARAAKAAGVASARPYDLRHSFASLLLHEGRSVIYVARQLGHGAHLTLSTYGHVIDELEDAPQQNAEDAISDARARLRTADVDVVLTDVFPASE